MLKLFIPKLYIKDFTRLDLPHLAKIGIKLLICDIDNTLVPFDTEKPSERVKAFLEEIKENGIIPVIISNNNKQRVEAFAQGLDIRCYPFAKKPLKRTYLKVLSDYGLKPEDVATIGDQLMTDIFGANRCRLFTILTRPLVQRDIHYTKINRVLEKIVFFLLKKFKMFDRGDLSD